MSSKMNIALDFDGTYTEAPWLWNKFIDDAYLQGHEVYLVTCRPPDESDEVYEMLGEHLPARNFFFTSGRARQDYLLNAEKLKIDVWIDNEPEFITEDKY